VATTASRSTRPGELRGHQGVRGDEPDDVLSELQVVEVLFHRFQPGTTDLFLVTYALDEGARRTLRSTLWRRTPHGWSVEFHQGTVVGPDR
jgi:hypothetical protein